MGFMALHCTCWSPDQVKFSEMMGIEGIMHGPVQDVSMYNFNPDHPISAGIEDFVMPEGQRTSGSSSSTRTRSRSTRPSGAKDKRHDIAGWALENGNGRIVGLVAGHTYTAWRNPTYRKLYWRGAHWALGREIPEFG